MVVPLERCNVVAIDPCLLDDLIDRKSLLEPGGLQSFSDGFRLDHPLSPILQTSAGNPIHATIRVGSAGSAKVRRACYVPENQ